MTDNEKRKYIEEVFKYCKTDSILVINKTGHLQRLQCPFEVVVISDVGELHKFGLALLIVYLNKQKGELIKANENVGNEYPHLVAKNPKDELLYIWVKTDMYPIIPSIVSIENHEEVCKLSNQFNAIPVFAGMRLTCVSTEENSIPVYGAGYVAEFTGFKAF